MKKKDGAFTYLETRGKEIDELTERCTEITREKDNSVGRNERSGREETGE